MSAEQLVDPAELAAQAEALADDVSSARARRRAQWLAVRSDPRPRRLRRRARGRRALATPTRSSSATASGRSSDRKRPTPRRTRSSTSCSRETDRSTTATSVAARARRAAERMVPALRALIAVSAQRTSALVELPDGEQLIDRGGARRALVGVQLLPRRSRAAASSSTPTCIRRRPTSSRSPPTRPTRDTTPSMPQGAAARPRARLLGGVDPARADARSRSSAKASPSSGSRCSSTPSSSTSSRPRSRHTDSMADLAQAVAIDRARQPFRAIGLDAALLIHEHGRSDEEARAHYEQLGAGHAGARRRARCGSRPTRRGARTRSPTRPARISAAGYVAGDPSRFATLLTEQVRVGDLLAARP